MKITKQQNACNLLEFCLVNKFKFKKKNQILGIQDSS